VDLGAVGLAVREVADAEVVPRFGALRASDISEKTPGEVVTEADRACERALTARLRDIRDIPVVGEEAAADDASLTGLIAGSPAVWLVDPVDGTSNFVAGSPDHAVMVALVEGGTTVAAWMWQPARKVMAHAVRGEGAWLNETPVSVPEPPDGAERSGVSKTRFLPGDLRARVDADDGMLGAATDGRNCAGLDYPDLVAGSVDFLLYWRTLPWDHAPGVLFAEEAGCHAARPDGSPYRPGDGRTGLLVSHPSVWSRVHQVLFPPGG
jgi:fructose-1,6-bisphosphatase/inositol monophosphatase family enzyme